MSNEISSEKTLLKRTITVKSLVTDAFREKAKQDLSQEQELIKSQQESLEAQYSQSLQQLEAATRQGQNVAQAMDQLHRDANQKRAQLANLEREVNTQLNNLDKVENGAYVITGQLDNFVEVNVGENLYDRIRGSEILLKDGIVTAILG
jgi:chromosome segregation ATPase